MRALVSVILILFLANAADACTTFCTRGLFGRNYDSEIGDGMLVVNKRGVKKPFWTSRFGSVTFNQCDRDNPTGGMNDAGLVVELMWLDGRRYPARDARPEVGTLGWIQYQLDTGGSVAETIANAAKIRICENSVPLVSSSPIARATLRRSSSRRETHSSCIAARRRRSLLARRGTPANTMTIDDAFAVLDNVAQPTTRWSIVDDLRNLAVPYRTKENRARRSVRFARFDLSCAKPVLVLDIAVGRDERFTTYTTAANLVRRSLWTTSFMRDTPDAEIEKEAKKPDASRCAE